MINRRTFLAASAFGCAGISGATHADSILSYGKVSRQKPAKSTILFFLCGGASHIDTWDMKPDAPDSYRGPFQPIPTSAPGIQLCEHLPLTAKQAHHLALIHGVTDGGKATGDHHAGYYYNLTGHVPDNTFRTQGNDRRPYKDDWPFMGSVIGAVRPQHPTLPQVITLPHQPSRAPYTRPGQFAARLGVSHDPFCLKNSAAEPLKFLAPSLSVEGDLNPERLKDRVGLRKSLDSARKALDNDPLFAANEDQNERALSLLASSRTADAFDLAAESPQTRKRYGETVNGTSLLMARRLVEAGVPFVTVFWKYDERIKAKCRSAGSWDTHGNNFGCLKDNLLPEFDRCYSALLSDLAERGLLDETLVIVNSEMGRKPKIGDPRSGGFKGAGRDHWTACQSVLMAGGGIQGGRIFGKSDPRAEYPDSHPVSPADVALTVYSAMGIDKVTLEDTKGRPYLLHDHGKAISELF